MQDSPGGGMDARMRLIVGLGNPGPEYAWTPHNLGFLVVDRLAQRHGIKFGKYQRVFPKVVKTLVRDARFTIGEGNIAGNEVLLAKPNTYMNLSGSAVFEIAGTLNLLPSDVIVVLDDVTLPWGAIKIKERGSAGGHNGLMSIITALRTDEFVRVRLGAGTGRPLGDRKRYVLETIRKSEFALVEEMVDTAADGIEAILSEGVLKAMTRFNRRVKPPEEPAS